MADLGGASRALEPIIPREGEEAIAFMVRISAPDASSSDYDELQGWLDRSPTNRAMWQRLEKSVGALGVAGRHQSHIGALAERAGRRGPDRRQVMRLALGLCGIGGVTAVVNRFVPLQDLTADHLTLTGQQKTIMVPGGSRLVLAPRTAVNTDFDGSNRNVELIDGQILMAGASDHVSVTLQVGPMSLNATDGRFTARRRNGTSEVVAIDRPAVVDCGALGQQQIEKGQCLRLAGADLSRRRANLLTETAWTDGLLVVDNETLQAVIDRMEPYYSGLITVDPTVESRLVTGAFPLGEIGSAVQTIGEALDLSVVRRPFWISIGNAPATPT